MNSAHPKWRPGFSGYAIDQATCVINADDRHVSIRLGSIHQAKGQTHFATLLLSTFQNHHSSEKIVDWLCGDVTWTDPRDTCWVTAALSQRS